MNPHKYLINERLCYNPDENAYVTYYKHAIEDIVNVDPKKLDERRRYLNMTGVAQFSYIATIFAEEHFPPLAFINWRTILKL